MILLELSISRHTATYRLSPVERKHHRGNLGIRVSHGESISEERAFFFLVSKIMQHLNICVESESHAHFLPSLEVDLGSNPSSTWLLLLKLTLTTGCSITEQKKTPQRSSILSTVLNAFSLHFIVCSNAVCQL